MILHLRYRDKQEEHGEADLDASAHLVQKKSNQQFRRKGGEKTTLVHRL